MSLVDYDESDNESDEFKTSSEISKVDVKSKKRKTVQILAPSLSKFKDFEDEEPVIKKSKLNSKEVGLINTLPPCKQSLKDMIFLPTVVSKQKIPNITIISNPPTSTADKQLLEEDDDEDDEVTSFFSFETSNTSEKTNTGPSVALSLAPNELSQPTKDHSTSLSEFIENDGIPFELKPNELENEIILKLENKAKFEKQMVTVIDVNADSRRFDRTRWLTQQLTIEKESDPKEDKGKPSSVEKKKNQITFLAHQAKTRELELKNLWASSKQSKQQARLKYGF